MRLTAGGIRELHWHTADEWAIVLYGTARITAIDRDGKSFVADVKKNDLWYFPSGIPHSIQGLDPDGTEFMLVFDDGNFSESETVLLSDSMAHLPPEVLSKNFGVAEAALQNLPKQELFIFQTVVPGSLEADQKAAAGALGKSSSDFGFRTMDMPPTKRTKGGEVRIVDSNTVKVSTNVAMAMVTVHAGGLRELHWHPNADEWQYYISGKGRMTVVSTGNRARTMDFQAGDVGYVEKNPAALHREYRGHRPDLPGDVQERLLSRPFALGVVGPRPARAGKGTSQHRPGDAGCDPKRRVGNRAALVEKNEIPHRTLGRTGESVSLVGLGGYHLGKQSDPGESIRIIRAGIDEGINFLDNCWDYNDGESEIRMGRALRDGYRQRAFLMTKIDGRNKAAAATQINESLRRLQTDRIDLLQFHEVIRDSDPDRIFAKGGAMEAVLEAKKAGKIRFVGFTGHKSPDIHLKMLATAAQHGFTFDAVQMPLNVMDAHFNSFERKVLPILTKGGVGVLGMKPMGDPYILSSKMVTDVECLLSAQHLTPIAFIRE